MKRKYEFRTSNNVICCATDDVRHLCLTCQLRLAASMPKATANEWRQHFARYAPPDPYAAVRPVVLPHGGQESAYRTLAKRDVDLGPSYEPYGKPPDAYRIIRNEGKA